MKVLTTLAILTIISTTNSSFFQTGRELESATVTEEQKKELQNILDLANQKEEPEDTASEDDVQIVAPKKSLENAVDKLANEMKEEEVANENETSDEGEAVVQGDENAIGLLATDDNESQSDDMQESEKKDVEVVEKSDSSESGLEDVSVSGNESKSDENILKDTPKKNETSNKKPEPKTIEKKKEKEDSKIPKKKVKENNADQNNNITVKATSDDIPVPEDEASPFVNPEDITLEDKQLISQILLKDQDSTETEEQTETSLEESQKENESVELRLNSLEESDLDAIQLPQVKARFELKKNSELVDIDKDKKKELKVAESDPKTEKKNGEKGILEVLENLQMGKNSTTNLDLIEKNKKELKKKIEKKKKSIIKKVHNRKKKLLSEIKKKKEKVRRRFRKNVLKRKIWLASSKVYEKMLKSMHRWMVSLDTEQRKREKIESQMVDRLKNNLKSVYIHLVSGSELKKFADKMREKMQECQEKKHFDFCSARFPEMEESLAESLALVEMTREWNLGVDKDSQIHYWEEEKEEEKLDNNQNEKKQEEQKNESETTMSIPTPNLNAKNNMDHTWTLGTPNNPVWWRTFQKNKWRAKRNFLKQHQSYTEAYQKLNHAYDWMNRRPWNYQMNGWGRQMYSPYSHSLGWMQHNTIGNHRVVPLPHYNNYNYHVVFPTNIQNHSVVPINKNNYVNGHLILPAKLIAPASKNNLDNLEIKKESESNETSHSENGFPVANNKQNLITYHHPCQKNSLIWDIGYNC